MLRQCTLLLSLVISVASKAQGDCSQGIPADAFDRIVVREFSRIIDPSSNANIGNYAALNLGETSATLGASHSFRDSSILAIKVEGGTSDGVAAIWNNRKLSSNFSAGLQYHFLSNKRTSIVFRTDSCAAYLARLDQFMRDSTLKRLEFEQQRDQKKLQWELRNQHAALAGLNAKQERQMCLLDSLSDPKVTDRGEKWLQAVERGTHRRDSLGVEIVFARAKIRSKQVELDHVVQRDADPAAFKNWYTAERKKLPKVLSVDGVKLAWFSVGYTYASAKFKLFDATAALPDQVTKASYGTHEWRLQRSWYKRAFNAYKHSYFISFGASYGIADNHGDLEEVGLEERTQQGPDSLSRTEVVNYTVLKGKYLKDLDMGSIFADAYWFISPNKSNALHLFPSWVMLEHATPSFDLGLGFLAGYVKKDDSSNAVNVELFVRLNDLANATDDDTNAWQRSDLGLKLSFPFNFPQAKP